MHNYYVAEACQNTFVLWDYLQTISIDSALLHKVHSCLLRENRDDALILVQGAFEEDTVQARMLVLGQDGTLAEFCGNGARVCAAYLFTRFAHAKQAILLSSQGKHLLTHVKDDVYAVQVPQVRFEPNAKFISEPNSIPKEWVYAEILEPHLLIQSEMNDDDLFGLGRELNQRRDLFPLGINVNVWNELKDDFLFVKTFERGVQRLTQSCGTGSISCAAFYRDHLPGTVSVKTPGGLLKIILDHHVITLQGPAQIQGGTL